MKLKVLGSNSRGNCYILDNGSEALVIEAGADLRCVKKAVGFDISRIVGCVMTHQHNDHAGYVRQFIAGRIRTLALPDVYTSHGISSSDLTWEIREGIAYKMGNFVINTFPVDHDVPCVGFLINHPDIGKLLFVTDTMMLRYRFKDLTQIMVEANYADDILQRRIDSGAVDPAMRPRLLRSHMELETAKGILKANDLSKVENIILIRLSDGNSDETRFVQEIRSLTGKCVYAADAGMEIDLSY